MLHLFILMITDNINCGNQHSKNVTVVELLKALLISVKSYY